MASGNSNDVFSFYPEQLAIPAGTTAVIAPIPGQVSGLLKWSAGGSLLIHLGTATSSYGSTFSIANNYIVGSNELVSVDLRGPLYLGATGSTCVCYLLRARSAGV